ncbi:glycosyl hydrolase-related protein [Salegentibacter maritimus]|uniref:Alpha-mannosidase n=1 Tax=Salegentibacter maritimus TaxID=2794347 RepID=A0ABS0TJJ8_9FLAO|nr:glycosyl hydrolase-related protein [Salegentibacter maritimus]MBI6121237.1 hypothetical protein [Salegentibacter maritimus]
MKKKKILLVLILMFNLGFSQQVEINSEILIDYVKPYEYKRTDNNFLTKATLSVENPMIFKKIKLENGYVTKIEHKDGKAWVWLPVIGQPEMMKIVGSKKGSSQKQLFTPLVTSDWDHFKNGTFHIISSTHQDIGWEDTPEVMRNERIEDIIGPALDIMKTDEDFYFGMEQALNLKEFIEAHPERKKEIMKRSKEGRFTWGATYNQPYEGMQTSEQLVREMYFGRRWIKKNFEGLDVETAFNTDVPGRTLQFPQILAKSGVKNLYVSRMKEGFYDWYSPDGSSVFTYTPGNYGWALMFYKLFEEDAIEAMHKIQNRVKMWSDYYRENDLPPHFAIVISNDASGPMNYGNLVTEWNKIVSKTGAEIPKLRHSSMRGFMNEINNPGANFKKIKGDRPNLWAYIHGPGHHKAITASRHAGRMLPTAEIFSTINAMIHNSFANYPTEDLSYAFEESIYPDHGWGGKNGAITDSVFRSKLEFAAGESDRIIKNALQSISKEIKTEEPNALIVYNDLSWNRSGLASVKIEDSRDYYVVDRNGIIVPSQEVKVDDKKMIQFFAKNIPSLGYSTYYLRKGKKKVKVNKTVVPNALNNKFYSLRLGDGGITYLYDKELEREVIKSTRFAGGDVLTLGYDGNGAGEFTQMTEPNMHGYDKTSFHRAQWSLKEDGPLFTEYENKAKFKHANIVQKIRVYHQEKKIDFFVDMLNWDGTHNREFRFAIPLNMEDAKIKYEVPMAIAEVGETEMKQAPGGWAWGGTYDQELVETHPREVMNYISAETDEFGITMAVDVALADWIDPTREAVDYPVLQGLMLASNKSVHHEGNWYEQKGDHHFRFSLASHKPSDKIAYQFGVSSNHSLRTVLKKKKEPNGNLPYKKSFFTVSNPMVRISTIKKAEDDNEVILRLVEMAGVAKNVGIEVSKPVKRLIKTNLIEEEKKNMDQSGNSFNINIGKNSIDTYKLEF